MKRRRSFKMANNTKYVISSHRFIKLILIVASVFLTRILKMFLARRFIRVFTNVIRLFTTKSGGMRIYRRRSTL